MGHIRDNYGEIKKRGARAAFILAESLSRMRAFLKQNQYPFPVLSDVRREVVKAYGVWVRVNLESVNIARPAEVVVGADKIVEYVYVGRMQTDFAADEDLFAVLDRLRG